MRKHNTNRTTHRASLSRTGPVPRSQAAREFPLPRSPPLEPSTWYGIPCSVWPGGVSLPGCAPSWIPVKINPVLAEPRTITLNVIQIFTCLDHAHSFINTLTGFGVICLMGSFITGRNSLLPIFSQHILPGVHKGYVSDCTNTWRSLRFI